MSRNTLDITRQRQLMVDPRVVAESHNAFPCVAEATRIGKVIGLPDKLQNRLRLHGGSVFRNPNTNRIRIYYNLHDPETHRREVALAESDDGLHFEFPHIGLRPLDGDTKNNLVRVTKDLPDTDRMLHAHLTHDTITLDGRLNEPDWRDAPSTVSFIKTHGAELSEFGTTVRVLYDEEAVFIGFDCPGQRMFRGDPDGTLMSQEQVEIFIDPLCTRTEHYYFTVSCFGRTDQSRSMEHTHPLGEAWAQSWQASVALRDDGWAALVKIPYAVLELELGPSGEPGAAWGFNLGHNVPNIQKDAYTRYTNWSSNSEHNRAELYGALVFDYERFSIEQQPLWEDVNRSIDAEYDRSNLSVFHDPNPPDHPPDHLPDHTRNTCPPEERYKMTWRHAGYQYAATSADGLDFQTRAVVIETGNLDSLNTTLWDPMRRMYVMYTRWWFRDERGYPWQRRGVARTESNSFIRGWPERTVVMDPCSFPGNERGERDFYNNGVFVWGNLYLAVTTVQSRNLDMGPHAPSLMVSTDGLNWQWVGDGMPFIPRTPGAWDSGIITGLVEPVVMGDRIYFYYNGTRALHHSESREPSPDQGIGISWIRRDGFLGYWGATRRPGTVTTVPMVFTEEEELVVNAETTSDTGEMWVEVVGDDQFGTDKCVPFRGDQLDGLIQWNGAHFGELKGKPFQLRFHLHGARLYAFEVR